VAALPGPAFPKFLHRISTLQQKGLVEIFFIVNQWGIRRPNKNAREVLIYSANQCFQNSQIEAYFAQMMKYVPIMCFHMSG
jgi:hypothetical protein